MSKHNLGYNQSKLIITSCIIAPRSCIGAIPYLLYKINISQTQKKTWHFPPSGLFPKLRDISNELLALVV